MTIRALVRRRDQHHARRNVGTEVALDRVFPLAQCVDPDELTGAWIDGDSGHEHRQAT